MRARLITNGILSIFCVISFSSIFLSSYWFWFLFYAIAISNFIMGIITLALQKHPAAEKLTTASGILAILGGMLGINAIVSFIAVHKITNFTPQEQILHDTMTLDPNSTNKKQDDK